MKTLWSTFATSLLVLFSTTLQADINHQIQALEASIHEARQMGFDPAMISQMEAMLAAAKADTPTLETAPQMQTNYFDVVGRHYSQCEQYEHDVQAFSFCQAGTQAYIMYTQVFAEQGASEAAEQIYQSHVETIDNLVQYVSIFMNNYMH